MYKNENFADEIAKSMEKNLLIKQANKKSGFDKLSQAVDYLNKAADIFEEADMSQASDDTTNILASFLAELE